MPIDATHNGDIESSLWGNGPFTRENNNPERLAEYSIRSGVQVLLIKILCILDDFGCVWVDLVLEAEFQGGSTCDRDCIEVHSDGVSQVSMLGSMVVGR